MSLQPKNGYGTKTSPQRVPPPVPAVNPTVAPKRTIYANKPLVAKGSPLEGIFLRQRGLLVLIGAALLAVWLIYGIAKDFVSENFQHVEITNQGVKLSDAETNGELLQKWLDVDLQGFPARPFRPQFGYRMDFQSFLMLVVGGSIDGSDLPASCFRANLESAVFECHDGEIIALARIGDGNTLGISDGHDAGTLSIRGQDYPYSSRTVAIDGREVQQIVVRIDTTAFVILQMPIRNFSMARVMEVFAKGA